MKSLIFFLSGVGLGVGASLLLTPKSGAETRADLKGSLADGQEYIRQRSSEITGSIAGTIERGRQAARKTTAGVVQALEQATYRKSAARGNA